jgi:hypothetical protein
LLTVANGAAEVDTIDPDPDVAPVPVAVIIVVVVVEMPVATAELEDVTFGVLTKNQSAATGSPNPVSSTKCVRLKPMRLNGEADRFAKNGMKSAGIANLAGSGYRKTL